MTPLIDEWIYALGKELERHKTKVAVGFAVVTLTVVVLGFIWPKVYEASAIIYADQQNILQPLLKGQAEVTRIDTDQLEVVRERVTSPAVLGQMLLDAGIVNSLDDKYALEPKYRGLRGAITVESAGKNHIRLGFRSQDQSTALKMDTALVNAFVRNAAQSKRQESREAYEFIDNQVKTYKAQLAAAEDRLKNFKVANPGGSDTTTTQRLDTLRASLESLKLDLQTAVTRRDSLRQQLSSESQSITRQYKADVYRDALEQAQQKLATLRLSYQDTYPDIVSLKQQIADLKQQIANAGNDSGSDDQQASEANPVYQKLKTDLADTNVTVRTLQMRIDSTQKLIGDEHSQSKENAEYQAQLAELTRDYTVTKSIYEDMLERREKARLSMALDIQGQGLTYRIMEPPVFPDRPVGLRFVHFFLAAPILGVLVPIGLLIAYIQLDPRIRFSERLRDSVPEGVQVLAVIPHFRTSFDRSLSRSQWGTVAIVGAVVMAIYVAAGIARLKGMG